MDRSKYMREKAFEILDPNSDYNYEAFMKEFSNTAPPTSQYLIPLNFVNTSKNPNPEYATAGSSGFDLRASLEEDVVLKVGERRLIPTGLFFEIPQNFEIQVRPRSGLAIKHGITVLNTPGTVDSDYRGEVKVILANFGDVKFTVSSGDRIAQAVVASVIGKNFVALNQVDNISGDTERSSGGFGSTGLQ